MLNRSPTGLEDIPTPALVVDAQIVRRNIDRMAGYTKKHGLNLRPHTKTHKSLKIAQMQIEARASGLTVAKAGEAAVMAEVNDDLLVAFPALDPARTGRLAVLAREHTVRVAVDSVTAADALGDAAKLGGSTLGILVDLDVGLGRTGVQSAEASLSLARHVLAHRHLRLDGIMCYPGHIFAPPAEQANALQAVAARLDEAIDLWRSAGLEASIVSGGSTPTAFQSHLIPALTEVRPGTYVFHDMNCVRGGFCGAGDCAARILCTVVSDAVPGQVVLDAGSKMLTSDRCIPAPDAGFGFIPDYPAATITKLSEEHAQVDIRSCDFRPKLGERIAVIPNHICPCVNLRDFIYWVEPGGEPEKLDIDARGEVS